MITVHYILLNVKRLVTRKELSPMSVCMHSFVYACMCACVFRCLGVCKRLFLLVFVLYGCHFNRPYISIVLWNQDWTK
jgi:hypothetical protein